MGDNEVIFVRGPKTSKACSVLLRGANDFLLDEMDRSLHDVLCVVQRVLESKSVVAGGGAVEAALSMYLEAFATTLATKEQLAIMEFAGALLAIPKTLAVNAAKDSTELVAKLCAFHTAAQQNVRGSPACPPSLPTPPHAERTSYWGPARTVGGVSIFKVQHWPCRALALCFARRCRPLPPASIRATSNSSTPTPAPLPSSRDRRKRATSALWGWTWWAARR